MYVPNDCLTPNPPLTYRQMKDHTDGWVRWVQHAFAYSPLMSPDMEITYTSRLKTPLQVHIFPIWEGKP